MTAEKILSIARAEIGIMETPANSNKTKYGKWYGLNGQPWCMIFVQWCFYMAGASALLPIRTASCGELMRAAQKKGIWITGNYQPGDIVIYDFPGGAATDHCGIIESVSNGKITAIEGNTSEKGSQSNGGKVCRKTRPFNQIVGVVRPKYKEDDNMDIKRFKELWMEMRKELQDNDAGKYSEDARKWAIKNSIIQGNGVDQNGDPNYMWDDILTRQQFITVLYRFAKLINQV